MTRNVITRKASIYKNERYKLHAARCMEYVVAKMLSQRMHVIAPRGCMSGVYSFCLPWLKVEPAHEGKNYN